MNDEGQDFPWVRLLAKHLEKAGIRKTTGDDLYIASDYSGSLPTDRHSLIGVLVVDLQNSSDWSSARTEVRKSFLSDGRRMAFKNLNDLQRRKALIPFLQAAECLKGVCLVLAIDKQVKNFGGFNGIHSGMEERGSLVGKWKSGSFTRMIDITHTICALIAYISCAGQNIYWVSDRDDCFASESHTEDTRRMMDIFTSMHLAHGFGQLALGTTQIDEGDRFEEDLASIPDLAIGAIGELLRGMHNTFGKVPDMRAVSPEVSPKSDIIQDWFFHDSPALQKICCFVQPGPAGSLQLGTIRLE